MSKSPYDLNGAAEDEFCSRPTPYEVALRCADICDAPTRGTISTEATVAIRWRADAIRAYAETLK